MKYDEPADAAETAHDLIMYHVGIAERRDEPGAWNVEAIDNDGGIQQAIFAGPKARERAEAYAKLIYGV